MISSEQFAKWSFERDVAVGIESGPWESADSDTKNLYLAEALAYIGREPLDWPCGILIKAGTHEAGHPGCTTVDWRD